LLRGVVADCPAQHWIASFKRVEHGALRHWRLDLERNLWTGVRQSSKVLRENYADHIKLITRIQIQKLVFKNSKARLLQENPYCFR